MRPDPYYFVDSISCEVVRLRKGRHWSTGGPGSKHYQVSDGGRSLYLMDCEVYRNERDAAIALAQIMVGRAKRHIERAKVAQRVLNILIQQHDIGDCPYLVSATDL